MKTSHRNEHGEVTLANQTSISQTSAHTYQKVNKVLIECINLVTVHARPFSLINDLAFQNLIKIMLPIQNPYQIINMHRIRSEVSEAADRIRTAISTDLKNKLFCLKIDAASCRDRSFLGINAQYVINGKIILKTLGVLELEARHTSEYLKDKLISLLWKYQIDTKQIYSVTTDNGANMVKIIRLVNEQFVTVLHNDEDDIEEGNIDSYIFENRSILDVEISYEESINYSISGVRCAAHTLQLAVHDALRRDAVYDEALDKARICVRILRRPNILRILKEAHTKKPILDCANRWDSVYLMLDRLLEFREFINTHRDLEAVSLEISNETWNLLTNLKCSLEPAMILSKKLQMEQLTFGDFWYEWLKCILKIKKVTGSFSIILAEALENRQKTLLDNDTYLSAIYLDPRFNAILSREQVEKAVKHLVNTWSRLASLQERQAPAEVAGAPNLSGMVHNSVEISVNQEIENMLHVADLNRQNSLNYIIHNTDFDKEEVVRDFLRFPRIDQLKSVLDYWEEKKNFHSQLYPLALAVLSVPATQVSVERIFSALKYVLSPLRHNLLGDAVNDILVIQQNKKNA